MITVFWLQNDRGRSLCNWTDNILLYDFHDKSVLHEKLTINLLRSLLVFAFSIAWVKLKQIQFVVYLASFTAKKMKFFIKDIFSKSDQIRRFLRIWSHLLKKSLMENFIFCATVFFVSFFSQLTFGLLNPYCNSLVLLF